MPTKRAAKPAAKPAPRGAAKPAAKPAPRGAAKSPAAAGGAILTTRDLNRALLARQFLLARTRETPLAVIQHLVALQAQLPRPPFVGLWSRIQGFTRDHLHALLHDRSVVRATLLRGTLHLTTARDFLALRAALQPMLSAGMTAVLKQRGTSIDLAALTRFAHTQLPATFDDLRPRLVAQFPKSDERALGYAVRMNLPLIQVPTTDDRWSFPSNAAFASAESWLGAAIAADAAAHALVRRYLAAFGPATIKDAERWSAMTNLKPVFEDLRPALVTFRDDRNRELFDLPEAPRPAADTPAPLRLVADFDNLVLGHDDRRRIISDEHRPQLTTKNLQVKATLLVDGFVTGSWTIERKKADATLVVTPFAPLPKAAKSALEAEADALLAFVEPDATKRAVKVA